MFIGNCGQIDSFHSDVAQWISFVNEVVNEQGAREIVLFRMFDIVEFGIQHTCHFGDVGKGIQYFFQIEPFQVNGQILQGFRIG